MTTFTESGIQGIISDVQRRLNEKRATSGVDLKVPMADAHRVDGDWLYIVVAPAKAGVRAYDYVSVLGDVEKELRADGTDKVMLVPALED